MGKRKTFIREHSLSLVIFFIFSVQTFFYFTGIAAIWRDEHPKLASHEPLPWEFWREALTEYNLSTVADTWGIFLVVVLTKFLYERGKHPSQESK